MIRATKPVWLLTLLLFVSGCSGWQTLGRNDPEFGLQQERPPDTRISLKPGEDLRVTLTSGDRVTGSFVTWRADSLVIGKPSNYGFRETTIPPGDIALIEGQQDERWASALVAVIGLTVVAFGIVAAALAHGMSQGGLN